jgi:hypothetical protein
MMLLLRLLAAAALASAGSLSAAAAAPIFLPSIFGDHMVLQTRDAYGQRPFLWGWTSSPQATVSMNATQAGPAGKQLASYSIVSDGDGYFLFQLNPGDGDGQPSFSLTLSTSADNYASLITLANVTYGDVLLCSGQSNTNLDVRAAFGGLNASNYTYPNIRLFAVVEGAASTPQRDLVPFISDKETPCRFTESGWAPDDNQVCNKWQVAQPGVTNYFSAVCFFTGLELSQRFPTRTIGLIHSSVSGTAMQLWAPPQAMKECNYTSGSASANKNANANADLAAAAGARTLAYNDSGLFNAMIAPIARFGIRAVIWGQGESNSGDAPASFSCLFGALIETWRRLWGIGDFAWLYVQLGAQDSSAWPQYNWPSPDRDAQTALLPRPGGLADTTGQVVAYDLGDMGSPYPPAHVHYRNKSEVGRRFGLSLMHVAYGWPYPAGGFNTTNIVEWAGPVPVTAVPSHDANGNVTSITLTLSTASGGPVFVNDTACCWQCCASAQDTFQVTSGPDRQHMTTWLNATFTLSGPSTIVITPATPGNYTQIRYAYNLWPQCAIYNSANSVPVTPFTMNLTAAASPPSLPVSTPSVVGRVEVGSALKPFLAKRGPRTPKEWKGRTLFPAPSSSPPLGAGAVPSTPPMIWNHWNAYHANIDERLAMATADALVSTGLAALGYGYVNLDDGFVVDRLPNYTLIADPVRFPSGLKALADYVHSRGLRFGVYTSRTSLTCQDRPGSYNMEAVDAAFYCSVGVDFLKTDDCAGASHPQMNTTWIAFVEGFKTCVAGGGRPTILSVEYCNPSNLQGCQSWIANLAQMWRTTGDIQATWASVLSNLDQNNEMSFLGGPGHWNDA